METKAVADIVKDPAFLSLPPDEMEKVLDRVDMNFQGLPPTQRKIVIGKLSSIQGAVNEMGERQDIRNRIVPPPDERYPVGAAVGGIAGAVAGGGTPASVGLGVVGAAGGEAVQQLYEHATGSPNAPSTTGQVVKQIGTEAALSGFADIGGRLVFAGGARLLEPYARTITQEGQVALDFLKPKMPTQQLMPAQATEARSLDILQNIAEKSLVGGNAIKEFKLKQTEVLKVMADEFVDSFGKRVTADQVGDAIVASTKSNLKLAKAPAEALYNTINEAVKPTVTKVMKYERLANGPVVQMVPREVEVLSGGAKIDMTPAKEFVRPMVEQSKNLRGIESTSAGDDLVKAVQSLPGTLTYADAQALRSRLIAKVDEMSVVNKNAPAIGKTKRLIQILDEQIDQGLEKFDPAIRDTWRAANTIYKEGNETYNNQIIRRLVKLAADQFGDKPEGVVRTLFRPGNETAIARIKEAVDADTWKQFQSFAVRDMMVRGSNDGVLNGVKLENAMLGHGGIGEQSLATVFDAAQLKTLRDFATTLKVVQAKQGEGIGGMAVQLTQAGAIMNLVSNIVEGVEKETATIILGPAVIAKLMTNPTTAKWLIQGIQTPLISPTAGSIVGRLANAAVPPSKRPDIPAMPKPSSPAKSGLQGIFANQQTYEML